MKVKYITFKSLHSKISGEIGIPNHFSGQLPTVVLFHGLTNTRKDCPLIEKTATELVKNGFCTFRFDFYGSGESDGEMKDKTIDIFLANAQDAIACISAYDFVDREKIGLWGRSMGGTVGCLIPPNKNIKVRVLASPPVLLEDSFTQTFQRLQKKEKQLEKLGKSLAGTGKYKGKYALEASWFHALKGIDKRIKNNLMKLDTILTLGTSQDQKVTLDNICQIANCVNEPKRVIIYPTDHGYTSFEKQAIEESMRWFKRYLL